MGYNSSKESRTETKFGTQKDLKALNNLKYNYHFSESRDMSRSIILQFINQQILSIKKNK